MGRKQKHPEHTQRAQELMNSLLDEVVGLWTSEEEPKLKAIAEEIGLLLPEYDGLKEHHVRTYRQSERQEVCSSRRVFPKWEAGQP